TCDPWHRAHRRASRARRWPARASSRAAFPSRRIELNNVPCASLEVRPQLLVEYLDDLPAAFGTGACEPRSEVRFYGIIRSGIAPRTRNRRVASGNVRMR